jgi:hypothetical protein
VLIADAVCILNFQVPILEMVIPFAQIQLASTLYDAAMPASWYRRKSENADGWRKPRWASDALSTSTKKSYGFK